MPLDRRLMLRFWTMLPDGEDDGDDETDDEERVHGTRLCSATYKLFVDVHGLLNHLFSAVITASNVVVVPAIQL